MYHLLDDYALTSNLRGTNARLKVLFSLLTLLICVVSPSVFVPVVAFVVMSSMTLFVAKIPFRAYAGLMGAPVILGVISFIIMAMVYPDGMDRGLLILGRVVGSSACFLFLALTTPMIEIFAILKQMRIPDIFIELSMMVYRFIFVLFDEVAMMQNAQAVRGGYSTRRKAVGSVSMIAGSLFVRTLEKGERLHMSMNSRCYNGKLVLLDDIKPMSRPWLLGVCAFELSLLWLMYATSNTGVGAVV